MFWLDWEDKAAQLDEKMELQATVHGDAVDGKDCHYVVLQNGINGNGCDWLRFIPTEVLKDPTVMVIVSRVNETWHTHDGLKNAGYRLANLIENRVPPKARLTVVGHSLGGLIVRAALIDLARRGVQLDERWRPEVFCTFSTPHLGTFQWLGMVSSPAAAIGFVSVGEILDIGARVAGTGAACSNGIFSAEEREILTKFRRRILFGACPWADDRTVPCFSSLLLSHDCVGRVRTRPHDAADEGEPMVVNQSEMMPYSSKGDVSEFTMLQWEKFMVSIPDGSFFTVRGQMRHTGIISHGTFEAPRVRTHFWRDIVGSRAVGDN
eukprot:m.210508 g.210508  ORF g.210508 m.210508 type:complete len:322 (+) comp25101_c0_seq1:205-1170(+)